ncbi:MAG: heavy-metal-associated domain-containing protein [Bacteroidetes bacterium]|nr:heavy-metal-associated domain-containing protein [Bacteroidota bacterium]MBS1930059.1 heavy-metal-associated domain-containing protein [Bacteroidota bacterium]
MKILFAILAISIFSFAAMAQVKPVLTAKIKTPNARCEECKTKIETYLKRYDGVISVNVNTHKGETTVKFITDRTNIEEIKTAIANVGFDADDVPANPDFYKLLPKCCKKPEDGGVPIKKTSDPSQ